MSTAKRRTGAMVGGIVALAAVGLVALGTCAVGGLYLLGRSVPPDAGPRASAASSAVDPAAPPADGGAHDWASTRESLHVLDCLVSWSALRGTTVRCSGQIAALARPGFLDETTTRDYASPESNHFSCASEAKTHVQVTSQGGPVALEIMSKDGKPTRVEGGMDAPLVLDGVATCAGTAVPWVRVWSPGNVARAVKVEATFSYR
jgi:hypothetical protein